MNTATFGIAAAAAVVAFAAVSPVHAAGTEAKTVHCYGINSCKGTSDCKTAKSECKGQNGCKGQGWVGKKTAAECASAGGTVLK